MTRSQEDPLANPGHSYRMIGFSPFMAWIAALALFTGLPQGMDGWQQDVVFDSPRPLQDLSEELEARYGVPVTLEEPVLRRAYGEGRRAGGPPPFYSNTIRLVLPARLLPEHGSGFGLPVLKQILALYNGSGMDPVTFDAVSSEWGLHIVPVALRVDGGQVVEVRSLLDAPVKVEAKRRMASGHFRALCEAVSASSGVEVTPSGRGMDSWFAAGGLVPPKHATILLSEREREPYMFSWGVERGTGREALTDLLKASSTTLGWTLFCRSFETTGYCVLGLHPLQVWERDEQGRPVLDETGKPRLRYRWHDRLNKVPLKAPPIRIQ
jgi:hypothetical protein